MSRIALSACGEIVRQQDPDRFLHTMLQPADHRESLFALYAFNHEVAKTRGTVSEPVLGQIRLQWWREAVEECFGPQQRRHEVVQPLCEAIQRHDLNRKWFDQLIDARERDLVEDAFGTLGELDTYAAATSAPLMKLCLEVAGSRNQEDQEIVDLAARAWALTGLLRALPFNLQARRVHIPVDLQRRHGLTARMLESLSFSPEMKSAIVEIVGYIAELQAGARKDRSRLTAPAKPLMLMATLTDSYLKRLEKSDFNPFHPMHAEPMPGRIPKLLLMRLLGRY